jgi:hypothetical protein
VTTSQYDVQVHLPKCFPGVPLARLEKSVVIIITIITAISTVVLLRCHEAEDACITILRNVGKYLTLDEALTSQKTSIFNIRLFIYFLK